MARGRHTRTCRGASRVHAPVHIGVSPAGTYGAGTRGAGTPRRDTAQSRRDSASCNMRALPQQMQADCLRVCTSQLRNAMRPPLLPRLPLRESSLRLACHTRS
eukprot:6675616-Prymnesium_polylepis.1